MKAKLHHRCILILILDYKTWISLHQPETYPSFSNPGYHTRLPSSFCALVLKIRGTPPIFTVFFFLYPNSKQQTQLCTPVPFLPYCAPSLHFIFSLSLSLITSSIHLNKQEIVEEFFPLHGIDHSSGRLQRQEAHRQSPSTLS